MQPHARLSKGRLLATNEIANHYQTLYLRIFSEVHSDGPQSPALSKPTFQYDLYVPRQALSTVETLVLEAIPELKAYKYGESENDILEFLLGDMRDPVLAVVGGVGYGKTTLLRYISDYLSEKVQGLIDKVQFVLIDCFQHRTSILGRDTRIEVSVSAFLKSFIDDAIARKLGTAASPDNDTFWELIKDFRGFHSLRDAEHDAALTLDQVAALKEIRTRRKAERQKPHFYLQCSPYFNAMGQVLVLILDNVDALTGAAQLAIMDFSREAASDYACKIIVPMRDSTWRNMYSQQQDHTRPLSIKLPPPVLHNILQNRTEVFVSSVSHGRELPQLNIRGKKIEIPDTAAALQRLHAYLLTDDVIAVLELLSHGNLRRALSLVSRYYRSGRLRTSDFLAPLLDLVPDATPPIPTWLFWDAVLMGSRGTFISDHAIAGLVNLWSNGSSSGPFSHFVRLLLLSRLRTVSLPTGVILEEAGLLLDGHAETSEEEVCQAVFCMVNNGLLESPDVYQYENVKEVRGEQRITISSLGIYYLDEVAWNFTYISLVKDDVHLNTSTDIFQTVLDAPTLKERYRETVKFCEYLWQQEVAMLSLSLTGREKSTMTTWYAGLAGTRITQKVCRALVRFGTNQRLPHEVLSRAASLEKRVLEGVSQTGGAHSPDGSST